ncbi:MAG TPA: carboxypeptidase regulatory-like domain-containing protein, partial [Polyangiaceae bacterium]
MSLAAAGCGTGPVSDRHPSQGLGTGGSGGSGIVVGPTGGSGGQGQGGQSGTSITITTGAGGGCSGSCTVTMCPNGGTTSITGTVYDPAGQTPLYNVVAYVPGETPAPISEGAACETCSGNFSGKPLAVALSDAAGNFKITDAPSGDNVPLVLQVGKWRRQIVIPHVESCTDTALTDKNQTRLPRNQSEGDIPRIAIATGGSDSLECLLKKIGVDQAEFTPASGTGRVHLYAGYRAATTMQMGTSSVALTTTDTLWNSLDGLMRYDVMLMSCEGDSGVSESRSLTQLQNVRGYADKGGKIFGSHYHNNWIRSEEGQPDWPYPQVVQFASGAHGFTTDVTALIDTTFPKGVALRDWLMNVGATPTPGQIVIKGGEHTVDAVVPGLATQWIYGTDADRKTPMVQYFSFTAPIGQAECGRMVFSDLHVSTGSGDSSKVPFPTGCTAQPLSAQERALEFMLFDLSS